MLHINFMDPLLFWIGAPCVLLAGFAMAWYSTKAIEGARNFYGAQALLDLFSPQNALQTKALWGQWILFFLVLVTAAAGPNGTNAPEMARAGALQVAFVHDVSPSMGAEEYRAYIPAPLGTQVPGPMYQWGTRIDQAKRIMENDFIPQLKDNEVGLITVEGKGYNMWDLTRDHNGALKYMYQKFVKVGAAPGGGADYTSGIQAALDEFKLIGGTDKERFIVLFGDGGFTGDKAELDKVLQTLVKDKIHLLMIGVGGPSAITVPKYDPTTHQRNGALKEPPGTKRKSSNT